MGSVDLKRLGMNVALAGLAAFAGAIAATGGDLTISAVVAAGYAAIRAAAGYAASALGHAVPVDES